MPLRLRPDRNVLVVDDGRVLVGGHPGRLLRLSANGAALVRAWFAGQEVGSGLGSAQRLVDAGLAHPELPPAESCNDVTVVVPVRDQPQRLDRCLAALRVATPEGAIVVVDDDSPDRAGDRAVAAPPRCDRASPRHGSWCCGRAQHRARRGDDRPGRLRRLRRRRHTVVAARLAALRRAARRGVAAPRVTAHEPDGGWLAAYEAVHSPLDMGADSALVGPGTRVPYVPSAALLARRDALGGGFDEALPIGEDVDLEWRLLEAGWQVRYVPTVTVAHEHRARLGEFWTRRRTYARSIGLLAARHPTALPAVRVTPGLAAAWVLLAARRPAATAIVLGATTCLFARRLRGHVEHPTTVATRLVARAAPPAGLAIARAIERCWWPLLIGPAIVDRRWRLPLAAGLVAPGMADWWTNGRRPHAAAYVAGRVVGDVAATLGTWEGCIEGRTLRPLLPATVRKTAPVTEGSSRR